jgi:dihydrofolate reductase
VARLKQEDGLDLLVMGSGVLVESLRRRDLVDEYFLLIHPLVLGTGRRLFEEGAVPASLALVDCAPTTTGVLMATFRPASRAAASAK